MHRILISSLGVAVAASFGVAQAADLPARARMPVKAPEYMAPIYNWTGFYLGINGGGAWGNSRWDAPAGTTGDFDVSGGLIGGTIGYNMQVGQAVWGIEGDLDWADINGSTNCAPGLTCETHNDWLGTVRGRLGYALNRVMPYVTGGLAVGNINTHVAGSGLASTDTTKAGWTVGAGLEFAVVGNLTAKAEYLYADLGSADCGSACAGAPVTAKFNTHIVRAGLNYRF
jgi:outer membrane immunogenic protein